MNALCKMVAAVVVLGAGFSQAYGQGTVTFDGPPLQPPGTARVVQEYHELGMWFVPLPGTDGFGRRGRNPSFGWPDNGTAYIQAALGDSLQFGLDDGSEFGLISVDLAEYSDLFQTPRVVRFTGYRSDSSSVTNELVTDGIIDGTGPLADFETLYFGPQFARLTWVQVSTIGWSLDNLVFDIPEPGAGALLVVGTALLGLRFLNRKRSV
jgi:hypothetical protein